MPVWASHPLPLPPPSPAPPPPPVGRNALASEGQVEEEALTLVPQWELSSVLVNHKYSEPVRMDIGVSNGGTWPDCTATACVCHPAACMCHKYSEPVRMDIGVSNGGVQAASAHAMPHATAFVPATA